MSKIAYLRRSVTSLIDSKRFECPNCGGAVTEFVSKKYVITQLRRCTRCYLQFRTPTDNPTLNSRYYESEYVEGFTTDMPTDSQLADLLAINFAGTEKSWEYYNGVLARLGLAPGARLFDFGCSWGYGSYQMARAGYEVTAFEVAPTRREYARQKLSVNMVSEMEKCTSDPSLAGSIDCFFSSHVLEHVPSPSKVFDVAKKLLRDGGLFVAFVPNGSAAARAAFPQWDQWWGEAHPNFIDDRFLDHAFSQWPRVVGSSPVGAIDFPTERSLKHLDRLAGGELFFAARK